MKIVVRIKNEFTTISKILEDINYLNYNTKQMSKTYEICKQD